MTAPAPYENSPFENLLYERWATHGCSKTYMALHDYVTAGNPSPSFAMLAWWGGTTPSTVWRALKVLLDHGYVTWIRQGRRNVYTLPLEPTPTVDQRARIGRLFVGQQLWRGATGATEAEVRAWFGPVRRVTVGRRGRAT